jgi:hypothetical protein
MLCCIETRQCKEKLTIPMGEAGVGGQLATQDGPFSSLSVTEREVTTKIEFKLQSGAEPPTCGALKEDTLPNCSTFTD